MNYRHVIWDWNGTLFDDAWLCCDVMNGLLKKRNMPLMTVEQYQRIFDFPVIEYYRRIGFDFARESFEVLGTEFIEDYEQRRLEADLRQNTRATLAAIQSAGITQSILSAYKQGTLNDLLSHFDLQGYFLRVLGQADHYAVGKMDVGRAWIEDLGVPREQVVLIGDTVHDHEVAVEMGCDCWLLPAGNQPRGKLESCGVPIVASLDDVRQRLGC